MADFDGAGGAQTFSVALGDNLIIDNFGIFGTGAQPADPAELDTLAFNGSGLTARNMILRQVGSDVVVTFSGVANTSVTFTNTTIETLENIAGAGNFRFNGEASVTNSINVWTATQQQSTISQTSAVTFLNDLANDVSGSDKNEVINGLGGNDRLRGLAGNDLLRGGAGDDILNGGAGRDRMEGGTGNDVYIVNSTRDVVVESTPNSKDGGWADEVRSSVTFSLASLTNVERLTLTGTGNINGTGNDGANIIIGNAGKNVLNGGDGNDQLQGKAGDDTILGGTGSDILTGGTGNDTIDGGAWGDTANFSGAMSGYAISIVDGKISVVDVNPSDGNDGTDVLSDVEFLQFKDGKLAGPDVDNIAGAGAGDLSGVALSSAGDVNGDGIDDIIVGAPFASPLGRTEAGAAYVIFGKEGGLGDIDLAKLSPADGFRISGATAYNSIAASVDSAGDVNGDGFDDVIVSEFATGENRAFVVYGKDGGPGDIDLATLSSAQGFRIFGPGDYDASGFNVSAAGDVNGDGVDDLIVGGPEADSLAGHSFVIYGKEGGLGDIDLADLMPEQGFKISGAAEYDMSGFSVSAAGDVNDDGIDDVIIGAPQADNLHGSAYVVYGKNGGPGDIDLGALASDQGFTIAGAVENEFIGRSVAGTGDINGDGIDDVIVGADGGGSGGLAYVVYGADGGPGDIDVTNLAASEGFKIIGIAGSSAGTSVSLAGDFNGDGVDDILVGAPTADPSGKLDAGQSYLIYGQAGGLDDIDLANLTAEQGFKISGAHGGDLNGTAVSAAGDVNNDGFSDLLVGAPGADPLGRDGAGESLVIYGGGSTGALSLADMLGSESDTVGSTSGAAAGPAAVIPSGGAPIPEADAIPAS